MNLGKTIQSGNEKLFLIEGVLAEVQTARTTVDLLAQIQQRSHAMQLAGGIVAVLGDMAGLLSNTNSLGLYDGDDVDNVAALIGGKVLCGTFDMGMELASGDHVRAVVSQRDDVLFAHSVLRTSDHLLLLPGNVFAGQNVLYRQSQRTFWGWVIGMWSFAALGLIFVDFPKRTAGDYLIASLIALILPLLTMWFVEIPAFRQIKPYGQYASAIFEVYGFPDPDQFDASKGMDLFDGGFLAMNAEKALQFNIAKRK